MEGPDIVRTNAIAAAAKLPVILSGGIGGPEDLRKVKAEAGPNVVGVIVGRAIYENAVNLDGLFDEPTAGGEVSW